MNDNQRTAMLLAQQYKSGLLTRQEAIEMLAMRLEKPKTRVGCDGQLEYNDA